MHSQNALGMTGLDTNPSTDITDAAAQDDLAWSLVQSLARSCSEDPKIPTWAAYNSKVSSSTLPLTTVAMMPLLAAPAHEWSTMLTVLKQAQNITTAGIGGRSQDSDNIWSSALWEGRQAAAA